MLKLSKESLISVGAAAIYPYSDGVASTLSFLSTYGDQVQMWRRVGNSLYVPRGVAPMAGLTKDRDHRVEGQLLVPIKPALGPRDDDQSRVLEASYKLLNAGIDHVVQAPTGWGKTWLGISLGMLVNRPTLILVTKEDLVHSWRKTILNPPDAQEEPGMGLPPSCIGHAQGDVLNYQGKRFVIGMIHSLSKLNKYPPEFWNYFGLGLFDEVHRLGADTFQEVCYLLPAKLRLGLSATPDRKDGKDRVIQSHIGPTLVKGTKIPMKAKVLVKETGWFIPEGVPYGPGQMGVVTNIMARNVARNKLIVEFVLDAFKADRTTVVMSDLVDGHLKPLFQLLCDAGIGGEHIGFYIGQATADKHKAKLSLDEAAKKRVVLATYGMTKEGTDKPWWDTLVLATPKGDAEQAIGRVTRYKKDKKQPVILDLLDSSKLHRNFYLKRLELYYRLGADIVRMDG
jgi:superfamily II DNA or RNA helicase